MLRCVEIYFAVELLCRYGARQPIHFALHEPPVSAFAMEEHVGWTVLNDLAGLKDDDAVEMAHRREPMRDGDDCAPVHQAA
jgi:hypothetical protein